MSPNNRQQTCYDKGKNDKKFHATSHSRTYKVTIDIFFTFFHTSSNICKKLHRNTHTKLTTN